MNRKLLLLSGRSPVHSAGIVLDTINILELAGCKVDFLTLYNFEGQHENQYNILKKPWLMVLTEILSKYPWLKTFRGFYHLPFQLFNKIFKVSVQAKHGDNLLVFEDEEMPPINPDLIFEKIRIDYDYYVIMIEQDLITSKTIKALFDKYKKPVIIISPDMYFFTGNCMFINNCNHYLDRCQDCPAYKEIGVPDLAHKNFVYKKGVFENIRCAFTCNKHVEAFIKRSQIIAENKLFVSSFFLDIDDFKPYDLLQSKKRFNIPEFKSFIVMVRYFQPNDIDWNRKGGPYLLESIKLLYDKISVQERERCLLLFVGTDKANQELDFRFDYICTGNLSRKDLILAYNTSSVFFCSSINDPGPSMVNQAMACSTPVVAFNQGTALDVIENGINGFKADLYDTEKLSEGLLNLLRMDKTQFNIIKDNARKTAIECNSFAAGARYYNHIFESFENGTL